MILQNTQLDFTNQIFHLGIDVHKKSWSVSIRSNNILLKTMTINPSAKELRRYMEKNYPGGTYYTVYEAGFCGFSVHRELSEEGFINIVINPSDLPGTGKEKMIKTDAVDSRKLARELENGSLRPIYVPSLEEEALRGLSRLRYQITGNQTRVKNRIKSYLNTMGIKTPYEVEGRHWSASYIKYLETIEFKDTMNREKLMIYLGELFQTRQRLLEIMKLLKDNIKRTGRQQDISLLMSVPGVGTITAITLLTEIIDIKRFRSFDELASFTGLIPSVHSSGERETAGGMIYRNNKHMKAMLIEAAWIAVRQDPAMTASFSSLCRRMKKGQAIVHIAKKLLSRISFVLRNRTPYTKCVTGGKAVTAGGKAEEALLKTTDNTLKESGASSGSTLSGSTSSGNKPKVYRIKKR